MAMADDCCRVRRPWQHHAPVWDWIRGGCVGITEMLYDTAKENVISAVGTLSNDQDKCLKDMVRSIAEQGLKSWKKASLKPDEGIDEFKQGGISTKMAPLTKRGMAQPSSGNRKKKR